MPRKAKMQRPVPPQDSTYGESQDSLAAQAQMGVPDNRSGAVTPSPVPAPLPPQGQSGNVTDPSQILAMLQQQAPPPEGGLARPTDRPNEPLLATPTTPAPAKNRAAEVLEMMASTTGDDRFARMAARARMI